MAGREQESGEPFLPFLAQEMKHPQNAVRGCEAL